MITYFETEKDQEMFKKALMYNLYLTVGTKHPFEIEQLYQKIASKLIRVQTQSDITSTQLGKCIDLASGNQSLILKSEKDFLGYEKWLFSHGTNLSLEEILEYKEVLFPIGRVGVNRK